MHLMLRRQGGRAVKLLDQYLLRSGLSHRVDWDSWRERTAEENALKDDLWGIRLLNTCCTSGAGWNGRVELCQPEQRWALDVRRGLTDIAKSNQEETSLKKRQANLSYEGPWSSAVRRCKKLSLFSTISAFAASPIILSLQAGGSAAATMGPKAGIAFTLCSFGLFTTGLLHWFTSPYIHRLEHDPARPEVRVTVLNLLARPITFTIPLSEIAHPSTLRPQASFQWKGRVFYIDSDHFPDGDLLRRLTPPEPGLSAPPPGTVTQPR